MKNYLFAFALCFVGVLNAQSDTARITFGGNYPYPVYFVNTFETSQDEAFVAYDTTPGNLWVLGQSVKSTLGGTLAGLRSMITDSSNNYPVNNYSAFTMAVINYQVCLATTVEFYYKMDASAGSDGGMVELSRDGGVSWQNVSTDPTVSVLGGPFVPVAALGGANGLSISNTSSQSVSLMIQPGFNASAIDTLLLRFVFASDSVAENRGGWLIDFVRFEAMCEGITPEPSSLLLHVSPNPASNQVVFSADGNDLFDRIILTDCTGRIVISEQNTNTINVSDLPGGFYTACVMKKEKQAFQKIIVAH